jgi:SAM-dependent methyltransferase
MRAPNDKPLQLFNHAEADPRLKHLYSEHSYLEAYRRHTDLRVEADPRAAVGGCWEEIGQLQFDFLLRWGLPPHHKLLDLGCGTLRGGRKLIPYLEPGNYSGVDLSSKAIDYAKDLVEWEGLVEQRPRLLVAGDKSLDFGMFADEHFDVILAQSVFTHLPPKHIEACIEHIGPMMEERSLFFFTYLPAPEYARTGLKDFRYPLSFFEEVSERHGFSLEDVSRDYPHPWGQKMLILSRGGHRRPRAGRPTRRWPAGPRRSGSTSAVAANDRRTGTMPQPEKAIL